MCVCVGVCVCVRARARIRWAGGAVGGGATHESSIRANVIFNCRESAHDCSSRLQSAGLPGVGNRLQRR